MLGGPNVLGVGINDAGLIVGYAGVPGGAAQHAYLDSAGAITDLGTLGGTNSYAFRINSANQIAGWSQTAGDQVSHAFVYDTSTHTMTDLGSLGGAMVSSSAYAINNYGEVVGNSYLANDGHGYYHAFKDINGVMTDLGAFNGAGNYSKAWGVNDSGHVVGSANLAGNSATVPFLYDGTAMNRLGTLGGTTAEAIAINAHDTIVGYSSLASGSDIHAFVANNLGTRLI